MSDDNLNIPVGTTVQLQLDAAEETARHSVRVIGYVPGLSLLVGTPTLNGKVQIVRAGQQFKVRMLRGDSVVGFSVKVLHSAVKPFPYLHLEYPKTLEQIVVRNSARVATQILCAVRNTRQSGDEQNFRKADIVDLSESGAKLASPVPLGEAGDMLQVNFRLELLDNTEELSLVADLKNVMERLEEHDKRKRLIHLHGVQFRAMNRFQQLLLHAWVMGKVASGGARPGKAESGKSKS